MSYSAAEQAAALSRIVNRRRDRCSSLAPSVIKTMISKAWKEFATSEQTSKSFIKPHDRLTWLLSTHLERSASTTLEGTERRQSWLTVKDLLAKMDKVLEKQQDGTDVAAAAAATAVTVTGPPKEITTTPGSPTSNSTIDRTTAESTRSIPNQRNDAASSGPSTAAATATTAAQQAAAELPASLNAPLAHARTAPTTAAAAATAVAAQQTAVLPTTNDGHASAMLNAPLASARTARRPSNSSSNNNGATTAAAPLNGTRNVPAPRTAAAAPQQKDPWNPRQPIDTSNNHQTASRKGNSLVAANSSNRPSHQNNNYANPPSPQSSPDTPAKRLATGRWEQPTDWRRTHDDRYSSLDQFGRNRGEYGQQQQQQQRSSSSDASPLQYRSENGGAASATAQHSSSHGYYGASSLSSGVVGDRSNYAAAIPSRRSSHRDDSRSHSQSRSRSPPAARSQSRSDAASSQGYYGPSGVGGGGGPRGQNAGAGHSRSGRPGPPARSRAETGASQIDYGPSGGGRARGETSRSLTTVGSSSRPSARDKSPPTRSENDVGFSRGGRKGYYGPSGVGARNDPPPSRVSSGRHSNDSERRGGDNRSEARSNPDVNSSRDKAAPTASRPAAVTSTADRPSRWGEPHASAAPDPLTSEPKSVSIFVSADPEPTCSRALKARTPAQITFTSSTLVAQSARDLRARLANWDPFWIEVDCVTTGITGKVDTSQLEAAQTATRFDANIEGLLKRNKDETAKLNWQKTNTDGPNDGDYGVLLRMLPLPSNAASKRADFHLWPKGTFLQINGTRVRLTQRAQQPHDNKLWTGMCEQLDITEHVEKGKRSARIQMCCYDDQPFIFSVALCRFRSADTVFENLMGPGSNGIEKLSRGDSMKKAIASMSEDLVVLDSDDDGEEHKAKSIFSLMCPLSKTLIQTPVRGKHCKHWQCFDLENFLKSNARVTGTRWRCTVCERFLKFKDLQVCGLTSDLAKEFKDVATSQRDRVELCSDETYRLLQETRKRYGSKRQASEAARNGGTKKAKIPENAEIIEL